MYMPSMSRGAHELHVEVGIEFQGGPSDGAHPRLIVFVDPELWNYFMPKKDLNPESLRWYLLL